MSEGPTHDDCQFICEAWKKTGAKTAPVARRPAPLRRLRMPKKKARSVGKGPQTIQKNPLRSVEASA